MQPDDSDPRLLTPDEHSLLTKLGDVANTFDRVIGHAKTRDNDLREVVFHVHELQRMVLANAAARAYPHLYRTLGGEVRL